MHRHTSPVRACVALAAVVLAAPATAREMPFLPPAAAGTGSTMSRVVAADFDGDGDLDLAAVSDLLEEVYWLEDTGSGFVQHLVTDVISGPGPLAPADVDCDGDQDLVIGEGGTDSMVWVRNEGAAASWSAGGVVTASAADLTTLAVADVTRSGSVDVVAGFLGGGGIRIFRRTGCASAVWIAATVTTTTSTVTGIALVDVDRDGWLDVAASDSGLGRVDWWESPGGPGAWTLHPVDGAFGSAQSLTAGDVDGDGDVDLAAASNSGGELAWWANGSGGSTWTKGTVGPLPSALVARLADVDRDGDPDLLAAATSPTEPLTWWDNVAGDGSAWVGHPIDAAPDVVRGLVVADLGADGDADVASAAFTAGEVRVYENVSTGRSGLLGADQFENGYPFPLREIADLASGDVDGDGDADLVVLEREVSIPQSFVYWLANGGVGSTDRLSLGGPHFVHLETLRPAESLAVGDVDGDGDIDVFVGNGDTLVAHGVFCRQDPGPAWACFEVISSSNPETLDALALADVDGDGDLDVLGSLADPVLGGTVTWWENDGDPTSAAGWVRHDIGASPARDRLATADLDGDGDLDVVGPRNAWWRQTGGGWSAETIPGSVVTDGDVGDVDGDGDPDLAARIDTPSGPGLAWFENAGGGGWIEHEVRPTSTQVLLDGQVALADLDVDGDLDLLATQVDLGAPRLSWFENRLETGAAWAEHDALPEGPRGMRLAVADFDRDGDPDVVAAEEAWLVESWLDGGGQAALTTTALVPWNLPDATERAFFAVEPAHRGRAGEAPLAWTTLALLFEEAPGVPLGQAAIDDLLESARLYLDDGSLGFDPDADQEVAVFTSLPAVDGLVVLGLPPGEPSLELAPGQEALYFLTLEATADASTAGIPSLRLTHAALAGSAAENAAHGTPLLLEHAPDVTVEAAIVEPGLFADGFESGDTSAWGNAVQ